MWKPCRGGLYVAAAVLGMIALAAPSAAANSTAATASSTTPASVIVISSTSGVADAFWSTLPAGTTPTPGSEYTEGYVLGAEAATTNEGGVLAPYAYVVINRHVVSSTGEDTIVSLTSGEAWGAQASFALDKQVRWATLGATVDATTCDVQTWECTPTSGTISVGWTAYGDTLRGIELTKYNTSDYTQTTNFRGSQADTWSSGTIFGGSFSGGAGNTFRGTFVERVVFRHAIG